MPTPLLQVKNLSVSFYTEEGVVRAVRDVSFDIMPGEIVGLVGESGSGKTVAAMTCLRLVPMPPGKIESGEVWFGGKNLLTIPIEELRQIRGSQAGVIFQEPMTALSPLMKVGHQLVETIRLHQPGTEFNKAWALGIEWLDKVGIPNPARWVNAYPYEFSGGMRQRAMIAMALILEPELIIADEPTTALDVTLQAQIFDLILSMKSDKTSIMFITHDMGVVWELADRVMVMKNGQLVESAPVNTIFTAPQDPYTQKLLSAVPRLTDQPVRRRNEVSGEKPLIEVKNLRTWFPIKKGVFARTVDHVKAVDDVSMSIHRGETLGVVGESGSGKTTLGRSILRLDEAREGSVIYRDRNLLELKHKQIHPLRKNLQMIFQDPYSSLNSRFTVEEIITEGLIEHNLLGDESPRDAAARWLKEVRMDPDHLHRYPHEFSGGQRQRICIAKAIAVRPELIICDEAVSALDVTIQAMVIDLLMELREKYGLSYMFISHDLSVVKRICDRVVVMRQGKIVEQGTPEEVVMNPRHAYTRKLVSAVPVPGGKRRRDERARLREEAANRKSQPRSKNKPRRKRR